MRTVRTYSISVLLTFVLWNVCPAGDGGRQGSFAFHDIPLRASLDSLMRIYSVSIVYLDKDVEGRLVSGSCTDCELQGALDEVLQGTPLMWIMSGSQVILRQRSVPARTLSGSISGFVADSLTAEWIAGATIRLVALSGDSPAGFRGWCPTNSSGFYSLTRLASGTYTLLINAVGYRSVRIPCSVSSGAVIRQDVKLSQLEIRMQEVTIEGRRSEIARGGGLTRGIYIRSTPEDQNQYFLDGARIYNPSHFGGVLSTFNTDALNDIQILAGGPPPEYGGRIGGILDLALREGTRERISGTAGTGTLGSHLSLEGPIGGATSFLVSARRAYPDPAVPFLDAFGTPSRQGSSELILKLANMLSGSSRLYLSGYIGKDSYENSAAGYGRRLDNAFSWGNSAANLRWIGIVSPSLFLQASAVYTRYKVTLDHALALPQGVLPDPSPLSSDYRIDDFSVRADAEHYYDLEHTFRAGAEMTRHAIKGNISEFSTQTAPLAFDGTSSWELAVYLQDQWRLLPGLTAELGARAASLTGNQGFVSGVDPRFSLQYAPNEETRLYASFSTVNEFLHPYRKSGVFLLYPSIFWYPSGENVKPSTSVQIRAGAEKGWADGGYLASADAFYRVVQNIHEFGFDTAAMRTTNLESEILYGTGKTYGFEMSLSKRRGDFTGSIGYTLAWGSNRFPALNGGRPFPPTFDRRHEVQLNISYDDGQDWNVGLLAVIAIESVNSSPLPATADVSTWGGSSSKGTVTTRPTYAPAWVADVNGDRYPGFQRLELHVLRSVTIEPLRCTLSLRLVNAYGLLDPFVWQLQNSQDVRLLWKAGLQELTLFPLFPTVGLTVKF